ncbi:MAG: Ser-Thr-rich GPI-anchored membrane family protein [Acidobacteriota bacterium]
MKRFALILTFIIFVFSFVSGQTIYDLGVAGTNYDIGRDNNGNVHLVWVNSTNFKRLYYGKIVNNAITGMETIDLTNKIHVRFTRPRMAVQPNGSTVHVTFISPGPGKYLVHLWRNSSGVWSEDIVWTYNPNVPNAANPYYMAFPAIGCDASGNVHLIAQRWYGEVQNYVAYWRKSGGTWSSYVRIEALTSVPWRDLSMFTDSSGGVHATWKTGQLIYGRYRYAANGASLANSTTINIPKATDAGNMVSFGDTFATDNGDAHHVYLRYADETLWHTVKRNGSSAFGELTMAGTVNNCEHCGSYAYENPWPAIGVGPDGTPVIAWAENRNSGNVNYINIAYKEGDNWVPQIVDNTALINSEGRPVIAVAGTTGYLVWRGGNGNLKLLVYTLGEATGVLSPNGGEAWDFGQTYDIIWNLENGTGNVDINLYKNDVNLGTIISDYDDTATPGKYTWTIGTLEDGTPIAAGSDYKIEVKAVNDSDSDISDNNFTLKITPTVTVTSPNGGEVWNIGEAYNVTWNSIGMSGNVGIKLFQNGISLGYIALDVPVNDETYSWTISEIIGVGPIVPGTNYQIQIKQSGIASDLSDAVFTIASAGTPSITVTSPNGGEDWSLGGTYNITWASTSMTGNVGIKLFQNGLSLGYIALDVPVSAGTYSWTISEIIGVGPIVPGINYQIQIKQSGVASDLSDAVFTISPGGAPSITVTSPNGGENWNLGGTYNITWGSTSMTGNVGIKLFQNGISLGYIALDVPVSAGTYSWNISELVGGIPIIPGVNYQIQIKQSGVAGDLSDAVFTISPGGAPSITVTSPNGGEDWNLGGTYNITWASNAITGNVGIKLFQNGISLGYIALDVPVSAGTYSWTISEIIGVGPIAPGVNYQIQIKQSGVAGDLSDSVFTISPGGTPLITVMSPNGGENWNLGGTYNITWASNAITGNVGIKLFQNGISLGYIALDVPVSTGTYSWTISEIIGVGPIVPGTNYQIQIKQSGVAGDLSDEVFTISPAL